MLPLILMMDLSLMFWWVLNQCLGWSIAWSCRRSWNQWRLNFANSKCLSLELLWRFRLFFMFKFTTSAFSFGWLLSWSVARSKRCNPLSWLWYFKRHVWRNVSFSWTLVLTNRLNLLGIDLDSIIWCVAIALILINRSAFSRANRYSFLLLGWLSGNNAGIIHLNIAYWLIKLFMVLSFIQMSGACISILGLDFTLKLWSITLNIWLTWLRFILLCILWIHLWVDLCMSAWWENSLTWVLLELGMVLSFVERLRHSNVQITLRLGHIHLSWKVICERLVSMVECFSVRKWLLLLMWRRSECCILLHVRWFGWLRILCIRLRHDYFRRFNLLSFSESELLLFFPFLFNLDKSDLILEFVICFGLLVGSLFFFR